MTDQSQRPAANSSDRRSTTQPAPIHQVEFSPDSTHLVGLPSSGVITPVAAAVSEVEAEGDEPSHDARRRTLRFRNLRQNDEDEEAQGSSPSPHRRLWTSATAASLDSSQGRAGWTSSSSASAGPPAQLPTLTNTSFQASQSSVGIRRPLPRLSSTNASDGSPAAPGTAASLAALPPNVLNRIRAFLSPELNRQRDLPSPRSVVGGPLKNDETPFSVWGSPPTLSGSSAPDRSYLQGLSSLGPHLALARACRALWTFYALDRGSWWVSTLESLGFGVRAPLPFVRFGCFISPTHFLGALCAWCLALSSPIPHHFLTRPTAARPPASKRPAACRLHRPAYLARPALLNRGAAAMALGCSCA